MSSLLELFQNDEPPIERAALMLARDEYPSLNAEGCMQSLDALAAPLAARVAGRQRPDAQAAELGTYLYDELGFHGNESAYNDPKNSYLNEVLARRTGIPISLAVVLLAVGRRAGLMMDGVGFPGHFLVRLGGTAGVFLDPFFHARVLDHADLEALLTRTMGAGMKLTRDHLEPVSVRAMTVRMLHNLKAIYERQHDDTRAMVVCDRLADLTNAPEFHRDRGIHALALGAFAVAVTDFERYLAARAAATDANKVRGLLTQARAGLSRRGAMS